MLQVVDTIDPTGLYMKKIFILLLALQGLAMATSLNDISIKDSKVPVVFEEGNYIPIVPCNWYLKMQDICLTLKTVWQICLQNF